MVKSYDISIDFNLPVRFPESCPVCGNPSLLKLPFRESPIGYFFGELIWVFGLTKKYYVPTHRKCYRILKVKRLIRILIILGCLTPVTIFIHYFDLSRWLSYIILAVSVTPFVIWYERNKLPIGFGKNAEKMVITVRNATYAREIAELNNSIVENR